MFFEFTDFSDFLRLAVLRQHILGITLSVGFLRHPTPYKELRYLIRELVIFISVYRTYSESLCGKTFSIDTQTAQEGLKLPEPVLKIIIVFRNNKSLHY